MSQNPKPTSKLKKIVELFTIINVFVGTIAGLVQIATDGRSLFTILVLIFYYIGRFELYTLIFGFFVYWIVNIFTGNRLSEEGSILTTAVLSVLIGVIITIGQGMDPDPLDYYGAIILGFITVSIVSYFLLHKYLTSEG